MGLVPPHLLPRRVRRLRRRGVVAALASVALVLAGLTVVMALSFQAAGTRSTFAALTTGRHAAVLAGSAVEETLAELNTLLREKVGSRDLRADLPGKATGGRVDGPDVLGVPSFTYPPARTRELLAAGARGIEISDVVIRPLYLDTVTNHGAIELACSATRPKGTGPQVTRRVMARYFFALDGSGKRIRVDPLPFSKALDRRPL